MQADLAQTFALDGKVATVTGAASGIGRQTAVVLAKAGAHVVISDIDASGLEQTVYLVKQVGGRVEAVPADVSVRRQIDALAGSSLAHSGRIDVWVNCAGTILSRPLLDTAEQDLERIVSINLKGVYWGCIAAGRAMRETGGGAIVNISSGGGETPVPGLSLYSLTKAGVNMLTRTVAMELGPYAIRANAIAPAGSTLPWGCTPLGMKAARFRPNNIKPLCNHVEVPHRWALPAQPTILRSRCYTLPAIRAGS